MSGGFRDSFTKEDTKEDILGYDDTAFYYFVISVLTCVAVPWTLSVIHGLLFPGRAQIVKEFRSKSYEGSTFRYCQTSAMADKVEAARKRAKKCSTGAALCWIVKVAMLTVIWAGVFGTVQQLGHEKEIKKYDPFDILDVSPLATPAQIKRAYRKLSLSYHPDKNPDDPLASSRFIQITKAYQALTDDVARRNFEKYGNPDGAQNTKVGIGLPRFLLEKDNHFMILCSFFFILLFMVPMTFICYYQNSKNYAANGILIETLSFLGYYVTESTRVKNGPEMFAGSAESRNIRTRPTDNEHIKRLTGLVIEHKKRVFNLPIVMKNQFLIWAHMQRRHANLSEELREDTDELLRHTSTVTQAMIEIACMREWAAAAQSMVEFRRCLIQALDVKGSQLLQVPHFTEEQLEICRTATPSVTTLAEFLSKEPQERRALTKLSDLELLDVEAFCVHIGDVEVKARIEVEDEGEIVVGDVATVTVEILRKHLKEGEALGPVHAPFFPEPKFEEWWLFLVDANRLVHFERVTDVERQVQEQLRFQVTKAGENKLVLHAMSDSYAGIDHKVELTFNVFAEDQKQRALPVHEEDDELDMQPTLFQQWMGDLSREDESEEEEEDGRAEKKTNRQQEDKGSDKRAEVEVPVASEKGREGSAGDEDDSGSEASSDSES